MDPSAADAGGNENSEDQNSTTWIHCDESSFPRFHHSGVLWLTEQDSETGGELEFFDADSRTVRRVLQPRKGRVALFSSGWENVHRVTKLRRGRRWSLPLFASLMSPLNATRLAAGCLRPKGSKQWNYCEGRLAQWLSAPEDDFGE